MPEDPVSEKLKEVLDRYFVALEEGKADDIHPRVRYQWRYYQDMTLERMRKGIEDLDAYWWGQRTWGPLQEGHYEAGPDLSRLTDNALISLFQELDTVLAADQEVP